LRLDVKHFGRVVRAQGRLSLRELALNVSVDNARFADAGIAKHDNFVGFLRLYHDSELKEFVIKF